MQMVKFMGVGPLGQFDRNGEAHSVLVKRQLQRLHRINGATGLGVGKLGSVSAVEHCECQGFLGWFGWCGVGVIGKHR